MNSDNKRVRLSSPDDYEEEYINYISDGLDDSEKENALEENIGLEIEQINEVNILVAKFFLIFSIYLT